MMQMQGMDMPRPAKSGVCYAFQRGECSRGDNCRFNHISGDGYSGSPDEQQAPSGYPMPTGVCYAFQRGECFRGDSCKYSHAGGGGGGGGMHAPPPSEFMNYNGGGGGGYGGGGGGYQQSYQKPCFAFQRGECIHGDQCRFSHAIPVGGGGRMGGPSNFMPPQQQRPSQKPCFAFINTGICERGDMCRFAHDGGMPGMIPIPTDAMYQGGGGATPSGVCFAFQRGQCTRGDTCRYAHIPNGAPVPNGGDQPMQPMQPMVGNNIYDSRGSFNY